MATLDRQEKYVQVIAQFPKHLVKTLYYEIHAWKVQIAEFSIAEHYSGYFTQPLKTGTIHTTEINDMLECTHVRKWMRISEKLILPWIPIFQNSKITLT